ncbi:hypothetical protein F5148DRAFT_379259 [Russula earlei]|uniref:Uncharacterized protein n=1 Tax=Russula earlei TaxID=71964 RepID=A0ACC0U0J5_9AGAM|nr:hypothetical protein F5148DRAFT_379259 [Russula earlei]
MEEDDRSPSPTRSSLPPPLHRHLRSAPQSSRSMPTTAAHIPIPWSGGQRSTTDPAFYTYPPPPNTSREPAFPAPDNQLAETTHGWQTDAPQRDVPIWDERFPHLQRIGHAESYTRADDSAWGGSYSLRRAHSSDWRPVPLEQFEDRRPFTFSPDISQSQKTVAEPSSSRLDFIPYVAVPEGLTSRVFERPNLSASFTAEPAHDRAYLQSVTYGPSGNPSAENFVSPRLDSVFLDVPGPPTTVDGSVVGQGELVEESPIKTVNKGKRRASCSPEGELPPLRRFRKKTQIACNFCRGRKLGCSGDRPRCKTCNKRGGECQYVETPRRRGPGRAPRGSRKLAKAREASARTKRSTPEDGRPTFPGVSFEMPLSPIQTSNTSDFGPSPAICEEGQPGNHQWRADSVNRAFLTCYSPGWGAVT